MRAMGFSRSRSRVLALLLPLAVAGFACGKSDEASLPSATPARPAATSAPAVTPSPAPAAGPTVVFLGDSLTAGYGLAAEEAYPAIVEKLLAERGAAVRAI